MDTLPTAERQVETVVCVAHGGVTDASCDPLRGGGSVDDLSAAEWQAERLVGAAHGGVTDAECGPLRGGGSVDELLTAERQVDAVVCVAHGGVTDAACDPLRAGRPAGTGVTRTRTPHHPHPSTLTKISREGARVRVMRSSGD